MRRVTMRSRCRGAVVTAVAGCSGGSSPTSATPHVADAAAALAGAAHRRRRRPALTRDDHDHGEQHVSAVRSDGLLVGGRVTFINQNNRAHDITSDPLHLHTDCPPVIEVGFIQPGQTKQTGVLTVGAHVRVSRPHAGKQSRPARPDHRQ